MSVSIRSCPGCDSLILADTFQCPDCGHVFDEEKAEQLAGAQLATAEMEEPCKGCGSSVRAGLVRCPDCGHFMREDIKKRYEDLRAKPQRVIYSDPSNREDYIPARTGEKNAKFPMGPVMDALDEDDGFELGTGSAVQEYAEGGGFELGRAGESATSQSAPTGPAPTDAKTDAARAVDDPRQTTDGDKPKPDAAAASGEEPAPAASTDDKEKTPANAAAAAAPDVDVDGLLNIARQDERESTRRRSERRRKEKENRVVVPCSCGAWMRVREHQMGKTVRCRKCGNMLPIPKLFRKKKAEAGPEKKAVSLPWMQDVDHITVDPANLKLKAGSVAGDAAPVDILFSETGIAVCSLVPKTKSKGGLFGSRGKDKDKAAPVQEKRDSVKAALENGGSISGAPAEKTVFIPADKVEQLLIVQPVKQAHESMFAGVPVFGEGRIALRIPAGSGTDQQFLSFGLTDFRFFSEQLSQLFEVQDFGKDQGVPQSDAKTASKCHYTGLILNALSDTTYYEADRHIELTLLGRKCGACGIAVCEESRKKQKIGGASGRGLSRAKCPKCNGKFGNHSLYAFELKSSAPKLEEGEESEDLDSVLREPLPKLASEEAATEKPASPATDTDAETGEEATSE